MMMQDRERIVLEALEKIAKDNVVLIGGYAANAYVPPRFSIDCDLVVLGSSSRIEATLRKLGFSKTEFGDVPYGNYIRYFDNEHKVSFDLLLNAVFDRDTRIVFEGKLFEKYSSKRVTVGRANLIRIEIRIADPELLFAMKFVTARKQDIRDIFMLAGGDLKWDLAKEMIRMKCNEALISKRIDLIKSSVHSKGYRDSLQGPYGKIPNERFNLCSGRLKGFLDNLSAKE